MADKASVFLLVTILVLVTIMLIFGMKYFSDARQANLRAASEDSYRALAERTVSAQEAGAELLGSINAGLADIERRLASVEKVLKEVE